MKICHVTSVHNRYDGRIFQKECVSLAKKGYDVTLLCVDKMPDEEKDGVKIKHLEINYKNKFDRILNSSRKIYKVALSINADVYHLHDPELIMLGTKLQKKGKKIIFDSHEDYPLLIMEKIWIKKTIRKLISHYYIKMENRAFPKFEALISVTPHIVNRLKKINRKAFMITNYPIINEKIKKTKFDNYICFAGGITTQWNHENIINALDGLDIEYKIAGKIENQYKEKLENLDNYAKVKYLGMLNKKEVLDLYSKASIGMALCKESANVDWHNGSLGNTKLFEYMASGVPVICSDFILWKKIIEKYKCGICVKNDDIVAIRKAINTIMSDDTLKKQMARNGIKAVQDEFNWKTQEKVLYEIYDSLND